MLPPPKKNQRTSVPGRRFPPSRGAVRKVSPSSSTDVGSTTASSSSSSASSSTVAWSDEYQQPFRANPGGGGSKRSHFYSELYAEVYNEGGGGARKMTGTEVVDLDEVAIYVFVPLFRRKLYVYCLSTAGGV